LFGRTATEGVTDEYRGPPGWLRERGEGQAEVRPVELFFDLVYVLAVTQLTHHLLEHLSLRGAGETRQRPQPILKPTRQRIYTSSPKNSLNRNGIKCKISAAPTLGL